jgi:hypothetical protein
MRVPGASETAEVNQAMNQLNKDLENEIPKKEAANKVLLSLSALKVCKSDCKDLLPLLNKFSELKESLYGMYSLHSAAKKRGKV